MIVQEFRLGSHKRPGLCFRILGGYDEIALPEKSTGPEPRGDEKCLGTSTDRRLSAGLPLPQAPTAMISI